ncbi:MAG: VWA domain-containing protein, partial [Gammaproteobacteria bacterium]|nr:VWA domain-containing protein [Gammaproteobacteria bacterium]
MDIEFQFPQLLLLILVVPVVIHLINRGYGLRESMLARFQGRKINLSLRSKLVPILCFFILVSLLLIAAGPRRVLNTNQQNLSGNIVIMVDVSRSMAARHTCNEMHRLDRAREIISTLVTEIPEAKFGFMGVAGLSFVLSELSYDRQYLFDLINHGLFVEVVPMPGSDLANAFHVLLEKKTAQPPVYESVDQVVLFSDGDITGQEAQALNEVVPLLVQADIEVNSVG